MLPRRSRSAGGGDEGMNFAVVALLCFAVVGGVGCLAIWLNERSN
jgi:hypothetical protein